MRISRNVFLFKLLIIVIITNYASAYDASQLQTEMQYLAAELYQDQKNSTQNVIQKEIQKDKIELVGLKSRRKKLMDKLSKTQSKKQTDSQTHSPMKAKILNLEESYFSDEISTQLSAVEKDTTEKDATEKRPDIQIPVLDHSKL